MRKLYDKGTFVFMESGGEPTSDNLEGLKPMQVGWHRTKTFQKVKGKSKPVPVNRVPVYKGVSASLARYIRSQRNRMLRGQRCNLTPGYVKS